MAADPVDLSPGCKRKGKRYWERGRSPSGLCDGCRDQETPSRVVVSATVRGSKSQKEVTTDADGYFSFARLPASSVTIQFDKKGYQSFKRPNVTVREKTTVRLNVEFLPDETDVENDHSEYPLLRFLQAS